MPQRVLILVTDLEVGGVPLLVKAIARGLKEQGADVQVACLSPPGPISQELTDAEIPTYALNARSPWDLVTFIRFARLLARLRPSVLLTSLVHANFVGRLVGRIMGIRRIYCSLHTVEKEKLWHLQLENLFCRLSDKTVCVSQAICRQVREACHVPKDRVTLIRNGIDIEHYRKVQAGSHPILGSRGGPTVLIFVGRLDPVKGVDLLIRAIAHLKERVGPIHLLIVGDGIMRQNLEALSGELGVSDQITFLGTRRNVASLLKCAHIKVMASSCEGLPVSAIEAMAAGLPVIASDIDGLNEVVRHGHTGILFPPGDVKKLAEAILECVQNPDLCQKMGANGKEYATRNFSLQQMISAYSVLLES